MSRNLSYPLFIKVKLQIFIVTLYIIEVHTWEQALSYNEHTTCMQHIPKMVHFATGNNYEATGQSQAEGLCILCKIIYTFCSGM